MPRRDGQPTKRELSAARREIRKDKRWKNVFELGIWLKKTMPDWQRQFLEARVEFINASEERAAAKKKAAKEIRRARRQREIDIAKVSVRPLMDRLARNSATMTHSEVTIAKEKVSTMFKKIPRAQRAELQPKGTNP